jgi:hypothetical protein
MQNAVAEPSPCTECGHLVYEPLLAPVLHQQDACRAFDGGERCGCTSAVHRLPTTRPRHRLGDVGVAS